MKDHSVHYINGMENCRKGNFEAGILDFDKALVLNPHHLESLYNRAKAKFKLKRLEECLVDFDLALKIDPDNPVLFSERAVVYYHIGKTDQALKDLDNAVVLDPDNAYRYASRAYIKDKAGDPHGAINDYNKAVALDPEDAISFNNRGLVEEKLGYVNQAKASFNKADTLSGNPPSVDKTSEENNLKKDIDKETGPSNRKSSFPLRDYYHTGKKVFVTKKGFKDFLSFTIDLFRKS